MAGGISAFINAYVFIAPVVIYIILASTLVKLRRMARGHGFVARAFKWMSIRRLMACVFAVVFTALIFGMPISNGVSVNLLDSFTRAGTLFVKMALTSPLFYAMYAALLTVFVFSRWERVSRALEKCCDGIEAAGKYFIPLVPLLMLAIGAYLFNIPSIIQQEVGAAAVEQYMHTVTIFGTQISPGAGGILLVYVIGGLLVGLACMIWHFSFVIYTRLKVKWFSIRRYFTRYWGGVYPLLWATSSEAMATPLNLYLVKRHFPRVRSAVRRFVIGTGSFLSINGTMICVFVLAGLVASLLGIQISLIQLLLAVPVVFLLGYGVPGIPGELMLFAAPLVLVLGIPAAMVPIFLALYVGLQMGLPDSFRTGCNSTDNCVFAVLINEDVRKREEKWKRLKAFGKMLRRRKER
jgi:hypothetical protein